MFYRSLTLKGVVAAITLAAFVIMMGCNSQGPTSDGYSSTSAEKRRVPVSDRTSSASIQLHSGTVVLQDVIVESYKPQVTIEYDYLVAGARESRTLEIQVLEDGELKRVEMTVVNELDSLEALLAFSYTNSDSATLWIEEAVNQDTLVLKRMLVGDRVHETYYYRGASFFVDFTEGEVERYLASRNLGFMSQPAAKQGQVETLESKVNEFLQFYPWDSPLSNNPEGQLAVELLTDPEVLDWIAVQEGLPNLDLEARLSLAELCDIANVAAFKCIVVGIANFICHAAVGVNVVCAFFTVLDWLGVDY